MLDYTIVATQKTVDDIKRFSFIFTLLTQALYIDYLIYAIITKVGYLWLNIPLLVISAAYFIFFLVASGKCGKKIKDVKANTKHAFKVVKITAASFNLAVLLYSIYAFPEEVEPISIVFATLMTVIWVLQLVTELMSVFFEKRMKFFITALKADLEVVTKPINSAQNFVRKIRGEDPVENRDAQTRERKILDEAVAVRRTERINKKREKISGVFSSVFKGRRKESEEEENEFAKK